LDALQVDVLGLLLLGLVVLGASLSTYHPVPALVTLLLFFLRVLIIGLLQPLMGEDLRNCESFSGIQSDHAFDDGLGLISEVSREGELSLEDEFVEVFQVLRFERHRPAKHRKEQHPQAPRVHKEPFIAFVYYYFWG